MICQHWSDMWSVQANHSIQSRLESHLTQERKHAMEDLVVLATNSLMLSSLLHGVLISYITKTVMVLKYQPKSSIQTWQMHSTPRVPASTSASTTGAMKASLSGVHPLFNHGVPPNQWLSTHLRITHGRVSKATFSRTCNLLKALVQAASTIQDLYKLAGTHFPTTRRKHILHFGPSQKLHWW